MNDIVSGLAKMREPFQPNQISKLPKPTKAQTDAVKADYKKGVRCKVCGAWHAPDVVHLDYVGHAALTDRLLSVDPMWVWEPVAMDASGLPALDRNGGLWIRLTVHGVTRLGYGDADGKQGGNAVKEAIGDALRNAAMRFGAALDLWHKGDLHVDDDAAGDTPKTASTESNAKLSGGIAEPIEGWGDWTRALIVKVAGTKTEDDLTDLLAKCKPLAIGVKAYDAAMYAAIDKAFRDRRGILNGELPA